MSDMLGNRDRESGIRVGACPIVQRLTSNFNVTSRSVEMAAQEFYTDAKFGCLRQSAPPQRQTAIGDPKVKCNQGNAVTVGAQPGMQVALTEVTTEGRRNTR